MDPLDGEILHEGWMIKSPPQERSSYGYPRIRKKWRKRWFVLRQGKLPSQFFLCYYTDQHKRRLKGSICLDECDQVDYDLKDSNGKYDHMFTIRTPKRMYFLALDTLDEMNNWVRMVCSVCGLRANPEDDESAPSMHPLSTSGRNPATTSVATPPTSSGSTTTTTTQIQISSPYIHISDCYTGSRPPPPSIPQPPKPSSFFHFRSNSAGAGTGNSNTERHRPKAQSVSASGKQKANADDDDDSVFEDMPTRLAPPPPRGAIAMNPGSMSGPEEVMVSSLRLGPQSDLVVLPPDRPPKPAHLIPSPPWDQTSALTGFENYANSLDMQEMYQKEANNNTNPTNMNAIGLPTAAPSVSRSLKPGRRPFESGSVTIAGNRPSEQHALTLGPPVERANKPKIQAKSTTMPRALQSSFSTPSNGHRPSNFMPFLTADISNQYQDDDNYSNGSPSRHQSSDDEQIYYYMPPINTTSTLGGKNQPLMIPAANFEHPSIAYIDLDLPRTDDDDFMPANSRSVHGVPPQRSPDSSSTIYKTIDIEKTDAFNRTKRDIENQRLKTDTQTK